MQRSTGYINGTFRKLFLNQLQVWDIHSAMAQISVDTTTSLISDMLQKYVYILTSLKLTAQYHYYIMTTSEYYRLKKSWMPTTVCQVHLPMQ